MANKKSPLKVVVIIVRREKVDYASEILNNMGAGGICSLLGLGIDSKGIFSSLGLEDAKCAVVLSVVKTEKSHEILEALCRNLELYKPNSGMAFSISISAISRNTLNGFLDVEKKFSQELKEQKNEQKEGEEK